MLGSNVLKRKHLWLLAGVFFFLGLNAKLFSYQDNLLLESRVPRESAFLGFCVDSTNKSKQLYLVFPEQPVSVFSIEKMNSEILAKKGLLHDPRYAQKKHLTLSDFGGYEIQFVGPNCNIASPLSAPGSLAIPSKLNAGEISAMLGYPFVKGCVLKYQPLKGKLQILDSSNDKRKPLRTYFGHRTTEKGIYLTGMSVHGVKSDCSLAFASELDFELGTDMVSVFPSDVQGHSVSLGFTTDSLTGSPVEKSIIHVSRFDVDGIGFKKTIVSPNPSLSGVRIGWGGLQTLDFELDCTDEQICFRVYDFNPYPEKLHRLGEFDTEMCDDGLKILSVSDWSVFHDLLKENDVVVRSGEITFPGVMHRNAELSLLSQRYSGGKIVLLRDGKELTLVLSSGKEAFAARDTFLFQPRQQ